MGPASSVSAAREWHNRQQTMAKYLSDMDYGAPMVGVPGTITVPEVGDGVVGAPPTMLAATLFEPPPLAASATPPATAPRRPPG